MDTGWFILVSGPEDHSPSALEHLRAMAFGELAKLAAPGLLGYFSDLYHDALRIHELLPGDGAVTFYYSFDNSGTQIAANEADLYREHRYRVEIAVRKSEQSDIERWMMHIQGA